VVIAIGARVMAPGSEALKLEPVELSAVYDPGGDEMEPYERLLGDAMLGDAMLFAREDAVEAAWAVVQPILGDATAVHDYAPGTWGPHEANQLTALIGGWHNPSPQAMATAAQSAK
jgi:glucose-6-phosphate 1-dehydrogenase